MTKTASSAAAAFSWRALQMMLWGVPALIAWFTPYRFLKARVLGIGHLAIELDYFVKQRALGAYPDVKPIVFTKRKHGLNAALLDIWGKHIKVFTNRVAYDLLRPFTLFPFVCIELEDVVRRVDQAVHYPRIVEQWGDRPPIFQLPGELFVEGRRALRDMGVPEDAWFVAVHARDSVYSPNDEYLYSYRNCRIENYSAAVDAIIARGGWCIRMGEKGTEPLAERPGLVNYPDTGFKSDWMDLFLCNQARFFLGNTSGLAFVSTISGVPSALANMVPYGCVYGFAPFDISIPKALRLKDGTVPRFAEIFGSELSTYRSNREFDNAGVTLTENTAQQIRDLTNEMLDVLEGKPQRTLEDEFRQQSFRKLLTPRHFSYDTRSRIGTAFLREHAHLL